MDKNNSGSIDKDECKKYWGGKFGKFANMNTEALFKSVDFDKSG